jgi:hypothetical protein
MSASAGPEQIPEFLRGPDPDLPRPPETKRPGSNPPPGKIKDSNQTLAHPEIESQAIGPDGRKLLSFSALDAIQPALRLKAYRSILDWQSAPPTPKQLDYLVGIGIATDQITSRGLAAKIIDHFRSRRERGLASLRQLVALVGAGVDGADYIEFEEASRILAQKYGSRLGGPRS